MFPSSFYVEWSEKVSVDPMDGNTPPTTYKPKWEPTYSGQIWIWTDFRYMYLADTNPTS